MDGQVVRILQTAGGPRSTTELAKSCRVSKEEARNACGLLAAAGQIITISDDMWCFNPKFGKSTGSATSFAKRPLSRPVPGSSVTRTPGPPPRFQGSHSFQSRSTNPLPSASRRTAPPPPSRLFAPTALQPLNQHSSSSNQTQQSPRPLQPIRQANTRPPPRPNNRPPPRPIRTAGPPRHSESSAPPRPHLTPSGISSAGDTDSLNMLSIHSSRRGFTQSDEIEDTAQQANTRPPPRPNNRPPPRPIRTAGPPSHSESSAPPRPHLTPSGISSAGDTDSLNMLNIHSSRRGFTQSDEIEDTAQDAVALSSSEKQLLNKIKSNNTPWTIRQLKHGGCPASYSLCSGLVDRELIIKIDMGNDEPMYAINPKKITAAPSVPLKRPGPSSFPGDRYSTQPAKTQKLNNLTNIKISSKIAHDSINKNPISAIIELSQAQGWSATFNISRTSGSTNRKKFHMRLTMGDRTFDSVATSKKVAKQNVAELALRILHSESSGGGPVHASVVDVTQKTSRDPEVIVTKILQFTPVAVSKIEGTGFFGKAGRFSYDTYNKLASSVQLSTVGRKVISVFFIEDTRSGMSLWSPVSLGSGNRTVNGNNINFEGKTVNDSHAEITARRGFRRFLWKQLRIVTDKEMNSLPFDAILDKSSTGKYTVCRGVKIHIFISTAPCGDSAIFPITEATHSNEHMITHQPVMENDKQGLLRSKMECGQGTNPTSISEDPLTIDGIMMGDQRLKTMSCSDKISRWNVLGLQGCLLSRYLEPVYMSSLTLGCLYHHGHLSRAVCCRYTGIPLLPPYKLNHPLLGCVPGQEAERELGKTNEMSMNWCTGDDRVEVLDGCRGRCAKGIVSRLARVSILQEYSKFTGTECKDYNKVKEQFAEYTKTKDVYSKFVKEKNYGVWIKKPVY